MEAPATPNMVATQTPQRRLMKYGKMKPKMDASMKGKKPRGKNPRRKSREMK